MFRRERTIYEGDTAHEHYEVVDMVYEGRPARVLFTNHHRAAQSGIATDKKPEPLFDYNQRFLELAKSLYPRNILLIGGGAYTLPIALTEALPKASIEVVEVDSGLDYIAKKFFNLKPRKHLNIIHTDGRNYLESTTQKYDLIIIDAFIGTEVPYELLTVQAAIALQGHLAPNGTLAMNVIGTYYGRNMKVKNLLAAYSIAFKYVHMHQADDSTTLSISQNFIVIGRNSEHIPYSMRTPSLTLPTATVHNLLLDTPKEYMSNFTVVAQDIVNG